MSNSLGKNIYGYCIDDRFFYHIESGTLIGFKNEHESIMVAITLRKTMANLFLYMLKHSGASPVDDDEILRCVWEANGLKSSYQRLWKVTQNLRTKLLDAGIITPLFYRVDGSAYLIRKTNISPLYIGVDNNECCTVNR